MDFLLMVLRKSFYIHWSAGRSPRVHEVNPGRDPSVNFSLCFTFHGPLYVGSFFNLCDPNNYIVIV